MPAIITRVPFARQPQVPVGVDWSNPASIGLDFVALPNANSWSKIGRNISNPFSISAGSPVSGIGKYGRKVVYDSTAYHTSNGINPPPCTWIVIGEGSTSGSNCSLGGSGNGSENAERTQFDTYSGTPRSIVVNTAGSASVATSTATALSSGEPFVAAFTVDATMATQVFFRDKKDIASSPGGSVGTYTVTRIGALAKSLSIAPYSNSIFAVMAWSVVLADPVIWSMLNNPWQLFTPLSRKIWVPGATGSSGPALSDSTYVAGSLTSTGWRPQITAS